MRTIINYLVGVGTILDFGVPVSDDISPSSAEIPWLLSDEEAIHAAWTTVGDDLLDAMGAVQGEEKRQ